jgi:hypothetical protein
MRRPGGRPGLRPACASSALRPTALLPTGFGYARSLAASPVGSYPTFSPLPSREGGNFLCHFPSTRVMALASPHFHGRRALRSPEVPPALAGERPSGRS